jgi:hypothetical protein
VAAGLTGRGRSPLLRLRLVLVLVLALVLQLLLQRVRCCRPNTAAALLLPPWQPIGFYCA